ncbi:hypothetical protein A3Q56_07729 [Intoshia linei]|uniref:Uncharacterized protein n=1 Tax=Intoshia linei TaxID=1819745 RepID=A0A177AR90_9BILA|nr:hypothetical protein A3Q56_07729 [Intoshia linei]
MIDELKIILNDLNLKQYSYISQILNVNNLSDFFESILLKRNDDKIIFNNIVELIISITKCLLTNNVHIDNFENVLEAVCTGEIRHVVNLDVFNVHLFSDFTNHFINLFNNAIQSYKCSVNCTGQFGNYLNNYLLNPNSRIFIFYRYPQKHDLSINHLVDKIIPIKLYKLKDTEAFKFLKNLENWDILFESCVHAEICNKFLEESNLNFLYKGNVDLVLYPKLKIDSFIKTKVTITSVIDESLMWVQSDLNYRQKNEKISDTLKFNIEWFKPVASNLLYLNEGKVYGHIPLHGTANIVILLYYRSDLTTFIDIVTGRQIRVELENLYYLKERVINNLEITPAIMIRLSKAEPFIKNQYLINDLVEIIYNLYANHPSVITDKIVYFLLMPIVWTKTKNINHLMQIFKSILHYKKSTHVNVDIIINKIMELMLGLIESFIIIQEVVPNVYLQFLFNLQRGINPDKYSSCLKKCVERINVRELCQNFKDETVIKNFTNLVRDILSVKICHQEYDITQYNEKCRVTNLRIFDNGTFIQDDGHYCIQNMPNRNEAVDFMYVTENNNKLKNYTSSNLLEVCGYQCMEFKNTRTQLDDKITIRFDGKKESYCFQNSSFPVDVRYLNNDKVCMNGVTKKFDNMNMNFEDYKNSNILTNNDNRELTFYERFHPCQPDHVGNFHQTITVNRDSYERQNKKFCQGNTKNNIGITHQSRAIEKENSYQRSNVNNNYRLKNNRNIQQNFQNNSPQNNNYNRGNRDNVPNRNSQQKFGNNSPQNDNYNRENRNNVYNRNSQHKFENNNRQYDHSIRGNRNNVYNHNNRNSQQKLKNDYSNKENRNNKNSHPKFENNNYNSHEKNESLQNGNNYKQKFDNEKYRNNTRTYSSKQKRFERIDISKDVCLFENKQFQLDEVVDFSNAGICLFLNKKTIFDYNIAEIQKHLCALLNTGGGRLYFGFEHCDDNTAIAKGVSLKKEFRDAIRVQIDRFYSGIYPKPMPNSINLFIYDIIVHNSRVFQGMVIIEILILDNGYKGKFKVNDVIYNVINNKVVFDQ